MTRPGQGQRMASTTATRDSKQSFWIDDYVFTGTDSMDAAFKAHAELKKVLRHYPNGFKSLNFTIDHNKTKHKITITPAWKRIWT